jgi:hypothetical protein
MVSDQGKRTDVRKTPSGELPPQTPQRNPDRLAKMARKEEDV